MRLETLRELHRHAGGIRGHFSKMVDLLAQEIEHREAEADNGLVLKHEEYSYPDPTKKEIVSP